MDFLQQTLARLRDDLASCSQLEPVQLADLSEAERVLQTAVGNFRSAVLADLREADARLAEAIDAFASKHPARAAA
jgi:hypothetical protein